MRSENGVQLKLAVIGLLMCSLGGLSSLLAQPQRTLAESGEVQARFSLSGFFLPKWSGHVLLGSEDYKSREPLIYAIDRNGNREEFRFTVPNAGLVLMEGLAGGPDGAIAVIGGALSDNSEYSAFVAWISPDRKRQIVIRLAPYVPDAVAVASDSTIWVVGRVQGDGFGYPEHNVMRRYDSTGKMLGSFLRWGALKTGKFVHPTPNARLVAAGDRVGLYTRASEYYEFALDGKGLGRFDGVPLEDWQRITGVALSAAGEVLVSRDDPVKQRREVLMLDRERRTWTSVGKATGNFPRATMVLGFDGDELLSTDVSHVLRRYKLSATPLAGTK